MWTGVLRPSSKRKEVEAWTYQDPVCGLLLSTPPGFGDLWEDQGDELFMEVECTEEVVAAAKDTCCDDPHIAIARKAVDACVDSVCGTAVLFGEVICRYCVANLVCTV
jgi:hypothetical protein